jgi:hypothetical protein
VVPFKYENPNSDLFYQIINVGGDKRVLSAILDREEGFWKAGFIKIIGLRDMFSEEYRKRTNPARTISAELNQTFIQEAQKVLTERAKSPENIKLCFSVMEVEAWYIGMYQFFEKSNPLYTEANISAKLGTDVSQIDPETTFFHPASVLNDIFSISGNAYEKHATDIGSILSKLEAADFEELYAAAKCASYNSFQDALLP